MIAFLVILTALHFLEPEFNPPYLISEYELGRFGWLMSLAFVCLGIGSLLLARAVWSDLRTRGGRLGGWWLLLIGLAFVGAGIFIPNPASMVESRLHGVFGLIAIVSSPIAFTLLSRSLVHHHQWSVASHLLKGTTIVAWLGLLSFFGSIVIFYGFPSYGFAQGYDAVVVGWTNRFMIASYCAWLIAVTWQRLR